MALMCWGYVSVAASITLLFKSASFINIIKVNVFIDGGTTT